jgi:hypothetical protein
MQTVYFYVIKHVFAYIELHCQHITHHNTPIKIF